MSEQMQERVRTISWDDPLQVAAKGKQMSGLEYLQAVKSGELPGPPVGTLLNMFMLEVEVGRVVFTFEPGEYHYNPLGMVHGGVSAALLDSALGCTVLSKLPLGTGFTTLDLNVKFVRAMSTKTGIVYCEGKILHLGSRIATAEGSITDRAGKLYAHATTTCYLFAQ